MARWSTVTFIRVSTAILASTLVLPGFAQHGGGHASFAGHSAPHTSGGFRPGGPGRVGASGFSPHAGVSSRDFAASRQSGSTNRGGSSAGSHDRMAYNSGQNSRSSDHHPDRYRRPYRGDRRRYTNSGRVFGPGWTTPYYLGYPSDYGYGGGGDQATETQPAQEDAYSAGVPDAGEPEPWPAHPPQPPAEQLTPPAPQEPVTLIFKDGRQAEEVRNYMLTGTTLYVLDEKRRQIPIKDLDLSATANANRDAGVDFHLPAGTP